MWHIAAAFEGGSGLLPKKDDIHIWHRNLQSWHFLLPDNELTEALTTRRLAERVDKLASVENVSQALVANSDAFVWLKSFLALIAAGDRALLDDLCLLPNQNGSFKCRSDLRNDDQIADDLKDIAEAVGVKLRDGLLDTRGATHEIVQILPPKTEEEALDEVLDGLNRNRQEDWLTLDYVAADVSLFWWIAKAPSHRHRLDGFPMVTDEENESRVRITVLKRDREGAPLAPPGVWPPTARPFGSLFPRRKVLHSSVAEVEPEPTSTPWTNLSHEGYVRLSPLFHTARRLDKLVVPTLQEGDEGQAHEGKGEVQASDVAFISEEDIGLIDVARKSRQRAVQLVEFLTHYLVIEDTEAFAEVGVPCECGDEHLAYPGAWLKPLHDRSWIPVAGRSTRISSENLANLLSERSDLVEQLASERGSQLLQALGVSPADFQLRAVAPHEQERVTLVRTITDLTRAAGGNIERVEMLVTEIRSHPEIIDAIELGREQRAKSRANQRLGRLVEDLLQEELGSHGLTVRRTGIGSDFEVDCDVTEGGQETWLAIDGAKTSVLIEVKSARSDRVRMTPTQAATAYQERTKFALCVVSIPTDEATPEIVRDNCRFVFDIGKLLELPLERYISMEDATEEARRFQGEIGVEISDSQIRFAVTKPIWMAGVGLQRAVEEIVSRAEMMPDERRDESTRTSDTKS